MDKNDELDRLENEIRALRQELSQDEMRLHDMLDLKYSAPQEQSPSPQVETLDRDADRLK